MEREPTEGDKYILYFLFIYLTCQSRFVFLVRYSKVGYVVKINCDGA